jgi:S-adenosyl methyltransferase
MTSQEQAASLPFDTSNSRQEGAAMTNHEATATGDGTSGALPFDTTKGHQARGYDYLLGGKDNYAADRAGAEAWLKIDPGMAFTARANRAFLGRAVRYLAAEAGIRQFLDIGTGIPTAGNTHEVAQAIAPDTRVVYVDYDPVVLAHARALLTSGDVGATEYIDADLRDTGAILAKGGQLLDFTQPVAIMLISIMHAIQDADDPHAIVATLLDAVPPGSYLALSHVGLELYPAQTRQALADIAGQLAQQHFTWRSREQVTRFFTGTDLMDPGLVRVEEWRPDAATADADAQQSSFWCAVGRKR